MIEKTRFLTCESQLKNQIVQFSFYLQFMSKARFRSYVLELNFVGSLAQVGESKARCLRQYLSGK